MAERRTNQRGSDDGSDLGADIEGLGVFYLGRRVDPDSGKPGREPLLLDARRLTTHAVCVGMTGSGKTGLLVSLIEEAAIDDIPSIVIDPKGDLANILLTFPELRPSDFRPWLEEDAAKRDGLTLDELAEKTAKKWADGLAASGQSGERIARLREGVDMAVYTPGSSAGRPLAMLGSLEAPDKAILDDPEARRERIESLVSGILAMAGIDAEPGRSREHLLVSAIVDALWKSGQEVDFGTLVRTIPAPPIERVGFLELENFFPAADRFQLASKLNTVAAAPGFDAWLHGEPLDVGRLLWSPAGKPRVSVISIAHLNDAQRMAFVTLLAGQAVSWMRSQAGTSSLKALFIMDEVFGYLPPTANPPSKLPLLTLLKQARASAWGSCSPHRIQLTSTTRPSPTPAPGSSAGYRRRATRRASSMGSKGRPALRGPASTGLGSIGCSRGSSSGCSCSIRSTTTTRRSSRRAGRCRTSAGRCCGRRSSASRGR